MSETINGEWNLTPGENYDVEGDLLLGLIACYETLVTQRREYMVEGVFPGLKQGVLDLKADVNGRQQFWHRQLELSLDPKRA